MIWTIFSLLCSSIVTLVDIAMFLRSVPPLVLDVGVVLAAGVYLTRLRAPKEGGFRLPPLGKCIAHRGAGLDVPENTLAAFQYCINKGCKYIELDVHVTKDGVPVVWHDQEMQGTLIRGSSWEQIKDIPVARGHPMEDKYGDIRPCKLSDALELINSKGVHAIIDMKTWDTGACQAIARHFSDNPTMYATCMVTAFNPLAVYKVRKIDPKIVGGMAFRPYCFSAFNYTTQGPIRYRFPHSVLKHLSARILDHIHSLLWRTNLLPSWPGVSIILLHKDLASPCSIDKWKKRGYEVALWSVNQPGEKRMVTKVLGVPYLTDTLVGEDLTNGFVK